MKSTYLKWIISLIGLLVPQVNFAVEGFNGPTWYDYRDESLVVEGRGTLLNPIVIETPEQLAQLSWLVNEKLMRFSEKVVVLAADIDLYKEANGKRVSWVPIGYDGIKPFSGMFLGIDTREGKAWADSRRHTIRNMYIKSVSSKLPYAKCIGLFGDANCFIGYLNIADASLSCEDDIYDPANPLYVGMLCGRYNGKGSAIEYREQDDGALFKDPNGIVSVSAEGTIDVNDKTKSMIIGGLTGALQFAGAAHCAVKATVTGSGIDIFGGICAEVFGYKYHITDCTTDLNVNVSSCRLTGGIAGDVATQAFIEGCSATGGIVVSNGDIAGGIVAYGSKDCFISGCSSAVSLNFNEANTVGGIVGIMKERKTSGILIDGCVSSSFIRYANESCTVGGIVGLLENKDEQRVNACLYTGTIVGTGSSQGAIAGKNANPQDVIANCYFDKSMYEGTALPGITNPSFAKGLTTSELVSGSTSLLNYLANTGSSSYTYLFKETFYPIVFFNQEWKGYESYKENNLGRNKLESEIGNHLFDYNTINKDNVTHKPVAWLCAIPVNIRRGDCANDFVSTVTVYDMKYSWEEEEGYKMDVSCGLTPPNTPCLKLENRTLTAVEAGVCQVPIQCKARMSTDVVDRPKPIGGTKYVGLNVTVGVPWDGSVANRFAHGDGTAQDPFIIKNGAQLALALKNNRQGEFYEQICDITLNPNLVDDGMRPARTARRWDMAGTWKAAYDGCGHFVDGALLRGGISQPRSLFGDIAAGGSVANLALTNTYMDGCSGGLAYNMDGEITNCIVHGYASVIYLDTKNKIYDKTYSGGICAFVGPNNPNAFVEDCVGALFNDKYASDYTPFVCLSDKNQGVVRNCLAVVPTIFGDQNFRSNYSAQGHSYIKDCHWLKGYEPTRTGSTLEELSQAFGSRSLWSCSAGYFPVLKTFAETDMGKLISVPVRTDIDYDNTDFTNYLLGFNRQQQFEPGSIQWTLTSNAYVEADSEMGIVVPTTPVAAPDFNRPYDRGVAGISFLKGQLGKASTLIPNRPSESYVNRGIRFVDDFVRQACMAAFDKDKNNILSLDELKAITQEQTLTAFNDYMVGRRMMRFPEFRFFTNVTELTTQFQDFVALKELNLPKSLKTLGSEAFRGCRSLKSIVLPQGLEEVQPRAFYDSWFDTIQVDRFNETFVMRDHALFDRDDVLWAYYNTKGTKEVVISGTVAAIMEGAFYKVKRMERLYFDTEDYSTVPEISEGALVSEYGNLLDVYVCDATSDGSLIEAYLEEPSWADYVDAKKIHRYYPLKVGSSVYGKVGNAQKYAATLFIGFDAQLPEQLRPYVVSSATEETRTAVIEEKSRRLPALTPVLILADEPGLYRLTPIENEELQPWPDHQNKLIGVFRDGIDLYQKDAAQGNILSPAVDCLGNIIFNYDKSDRIPPYHAYLTFRTVGMDPAVARDTHYDLQEGSSLTSTMKVGDLVFEVYYDSSSGQGHATLEACEANSGNIVVPNEVTVADNHTVPLREIEQGAFLNAKGVWSIDLSQCTNLPRLNIYRNEEGDLFYGTDKRTIIYLPNDRHDHAGYPSDNIVVDHNCDHLILTDGWDFKPPYEFTAQRATYDRHLSAIRNDDGTWTSRAYTVCLPFDLDLTEEHNSERIRVCRLWFIKDDMEFIFSNTEPMMKAGQAYLIVVNEGELTLEANNRTSVVTEPAEGDDILAWDTDQPSLGKWRGSFEKIGNAEASAMLAYSLQENGDFRRIRPDEQQTSSAAFRAFYCPNELTETDNYKSVFKEYVQGEEDPIVEFPTDLFVPDSDIPDDPTAIKPIIRVIENDGTSRYFDLQGRLLNGKPDESLFIDNGRKVLVK